MSGRRIAAVGTLVIGLAALGFAIVMVFQNFPKGLAVLALLCVAVLAGWYGALRRGLARSVGFAAAAIAFAGALLLFLDERAVEIALIVSGLVVAESLGQIALREPAQLTPVDAPQRPVLIFNPKSGGGKAERFSLATEAQARGIEPIELGLGQDLERIVREAVAGGADGLAMAGGDGSQAIVASIAAELDLPYACIPAGTRNHFALDLGVDRDDVVGALDAFVTGAGAPSGPGRRERACLRQQRFSRGLRGGGSEQRLPKREATHAPRHRAPTCSVPRGRGSICTGRARMDTSTALGR